MNVYEKGCELGMRGGCIGNYKVVRLQRGEGNMIVMPSLQIWGIRLLKPIVLKRRVGAK